MIISLHLPKTAGTSFKKTLKEKFGEKLLEDYDDIPMHKKPLKRKLEAIVLSLKILFKKNNAECIHGHFLLFKYLPLKFIRQDISYITWMRDPVERLASHYHFWKRTYDKKTSPYLQKKVVEENWSFERFCLCKELQNFYSQYLWHFPIKRLDFIGITEFYEEDLEYFSRKFLNTSSQAHTENTNSEKKSNQYEINPVLRRKIEEFHSKDIALYKKALYMRLRRKSL